MVDFEKKPSQSKKFIAFFFVISVLAALAIVFSTTQTLGIALSPILLGIILTIGFIGVSYIFSTAVLDKYVRVAELLNKKTEDKSG